MQAASAQVHMNVNLNLGSQPNWGPSGYNYARYYYMPDIDAYYDVPRHQYIFLQGNRWVFGASLPARYHGYDIYRGYKVVINSDRPYMRDAYYRRTYARYRGDYGRQPLLRDHRGNNGRGHAYGRGNDQGNHGMGNRGMDNRGMDNQGNDRGNPGRGHGQDHGNRGRGNGRGNGNGNDNGNGHGHDHGHGN